MLWYSPVFSGPRALSVPGVWGGVFEPLLGLSASPSRAWAEVSQGCIPPGPPRSWPESRIHTLIFLFVPWANDLTRDSVPFLKNSPELSLSLLGLSLPLCFLERACAHTHTASREESSPWRMGAPADTSPSGKEGAQPLKGNLTFPWSLSNVVLSFRVFPSPQTERVSKRRFHLLSLHDLVIYPVF